MHKERLIAANAIALVTHTVVSNTQKLSFEYFLAFRPNHWIALKPGLKCCKKDECFQV